MERNNILKNLTSDGESKIVFRRPDIGDGGQIHALVKACQNLDLNSVYSYLLLCKHFSDTCVVAEEKGEVIAFLSGYIPPGSEKVFFVWQVAVDERMRNQGLAKSLLAKALKRESCKNCRFLETTITPENYASMKLFRSLAAYLKAPLEEKICFSKKHFASEHHNDEYLFRIGPFDANQIICKRGE
ncbi:MAG: diaminobutyrate acetyltransferase [Methanotrichaceae archaeon]|nr:diaminobutyrate acetyltransferase [Methanotrichaceae archaeon]